MCSRIFGSGALEVGVRGFCPRNLFRSYIVIREFWSIFGEMSLPVIHKFCLDKILNYCLLMHFGLIEGTFCAF